MEIIFELLFGLLQFLAELVIQAVGEVLAELGLHTIKEPFKRRPNPWVAFVGYIVFGIIVGGLSLLLFPSFFIKNPILQYVSLIISPLIAACMMVFIGAWRVRRGQNLVRLDRFLYSFIFALSIGLTRFIFAQ